MSTARANSQTPPTQSYATVAGSIPAEGGVGRRQATSDVGQNTSGNNHGDPPFRVVQYPKRKPSNTTMRGIKRMREESPKSPRQPHASPFTNDVPLDGEGPEDMQVDTSPHASASSAGSAPAEGSALHLTLPEPPRASTLGSNGDSQVPSAAAHEAPSNTMPTPAPAHLSTPREAHDPTGHGPNMQLGLEGPTERGHMPTSEGGIRADTTQSTASAQTVHSSGQAQPAPAPPMPAAPALPLHAAAAPHAAAPAAPAAPALRPGDRYNPFRLHPDFQGLDIPEQPSLTYIDPEVKPVYRPSPSQVIKNTTPDSIRGFNGVAGPKFLVWVLGVGHRHDSAEIVATIRDHLASLVPAGRANNMIVSPFHPDGPIDPNEPMPWYFMVSNIPPAVAAVYSLIPRLNFDDGFTCYACPYDATIRGKRYIGSWSQLTYRQDQGAEVAQAFIDTILANHDLDDSLTKHHDAVPAARAGSLEDVRDYLASTVEASPLQKGSRLIWRVYMDTPTHVTSAFDALVKKMAAMNIYTILYNVGRNFKLWPCRYCRSLDHSSDTCQDYAGTLPGWCKSGRDADHPEDAAAQTGSLLPLPAPSTNQPHHNDTNPTSRGRGQGYRGGRGGYGDGPRRGGWHDGHEGAPFGRGTPYRGGGPGSWRGGRGYGRGGQI